MISATSATHNSPVSGILLNTTTPSVSSSSFTQQLAAALEQYIGQSGGSSNLEIDIQPQQSQNSGGSQFLVTVKTSQAGSPASASAPASTSAPAGIGPIFVATGPVPHAVSTSGVTGSVVTSTTDGGATLGPVTTPIDTGTMPSGYEEVPFGNSFSTIPTLATELANYNKSCSMMAKINPGALSSTAGQAGDPMYGVQVPGTTLNWDDLTQNQQLAYQHAMNSGLPAGQSMSDFLAANVGPSAWWNASYAKPDMFGAPPVPGSVTMYNSPYMDPNA